MMNWKPNNRFDLMELFDIPGEPLEGSSNRMKNVSEITTSSLLDTRESLCGGRTIRTPDRFMFLGETISDEFDLDPSNYNETIYDKDLENWQSAMKVEMESMYSNNV